MQGKLSFFLVFLTGFSTINAQDLNINAGFLEDSLSIGEEVHFWITAKYNEETEILFPDSNYNFTPWEYLSKYYEPTRLIDSKAIDSTVYSIQSFEIEKVQYLELPVIILDEQDSITVFSPKDSILFRDLVEVVSDTTQMKSNFNYQYVKRIFNFPLLWIIIGTLALILLIGYVLFGNKIRRKLKIRRLRRDYLKFNEKLSYYISKLKEDQSTLITEEAVSYWKKYCEKLEKEPFSKLTTSEILRYDYTGELSDALHSIDRSIYGGIIDHQIYKSFQSIEDFTQNRYDRKLEQLKHGDN